jgi:hypothetical protein
MAYGILFLIRLQPDLFFSQYKVLSQTVPCDIGHLDLKATCDVNLLSKLSIIFKEWRVVSNMYRGGARV